ncbi:MAG: hypothetical protein C9355_00915 [Thalassolituus maritimus]|nr:MAG: hypothetical protein C9355_00915 [Thalassolituus maritimus]
MSVLTALTSFALFLSGLFSLIVWYDDGELADLLPALGVAGMIWGFGLVLFGFSGPFFWCVFYFLLQRLKLSEFKKHFLAALLSTATVSTLQFKVVFKEDIDLENSTIFLPFILPVVVLSLVLYKRWYIKKPA